MSGEAPRPYEELAAHADRLLAAAPAGATLRLIGGIGIRGRTQDLGGIAPERRTYHDIDLIGRLREVRSVDIAIRGLGYRPDRQVNTQFGTTRRVYHHPDGFHADLFFERLEFCHSISLNGRLHLVPRTVPPADLLLGKLQIVERTEKDLIDAYWLLLNHELGRGDPQLIELDRLTALTARDWGLYTTASDFLAQARQHLPAIGLEAAAADLIEERLDAVARALEAAPKSVRWRARSRIGRRVRWYRVVEEVL